LRVRRDEGDLCGGSGALSTGVFGLEGAVLEDGGAPLFEVVVDAVGPWKGTGVGAKPFHVVMFNIVLKLAQFSVLGGRKGGVGVNIVKTSVKLFDVGQDQEKVGVDLRSVVIVSHVSVVVELWLVKVRWERILLGNFWAIPVRGVRSPKGSRSRRRIWLVNSRGSLVALDRVASSGHD